MNEKPILVTGATGKTGRRVAAILSAKGVPHRAASRSSEIVFDWDDENSWGPAIADVETAYLVIPSLGTSDSTDKVARFSKLLAEGGGKRVVMVATPEDPSDFSGEVRATERAIEEAGLGLTSLRLRWFFQNFSEDFLYPAVMSGSLRLPAGAGKEAFIDADDIAEVAVEALTNERHAGRAYELTGPRLLGFADTAAELSRATGRAIDYVAVTPEQFVREQIEAGVPEEWAHLLCGLYEAVGSGGLESTSAEVEAVLGRKPRDFSDYADAAARAGAWS